MDDLELYDILEAVNDFASFLVFVRTLAAYWADSVEKEKAAPNTSYGPDANGWENTSIENYLEWAAAWAEDTSKSGNPALPNQASWKTFAEILHAGKVYE